MLSKIIRSYWLYGLLGILLLTADIASKWWAKEAFSSFSGFDLYPGIPIFENWLSVSFYLTYITNTGIAWGLFPHFPLLLLCLRVICILGLFVYLFFFSPRSLRGYALLLILIGATGNVIDMIVYGHVIDMFLWIFGSYHFPVFNLADAMISIGVILLMFNFSKQKR